MLAGLTRSFAIMGRMTKKPKKIRLDELLVEQGVFPDAGPCCAPFWRTR